MSSEKFALDVLVVDDEPAFLQSARTVLKSGGIQSVRVESDSLNVMPLLHENPCATVLLDLTMPNKSGAELLNEIQQAFPGIPVIMVSGQNELETAVTCMRAGAFDYLVKPVEKSRFISAVNRALEVFKLRHEIDSLKNHLLAQKETQHPAFAKILTKNSKMFSIFQHVDVIADTPEPIMITGETGVGKEIIAKAIHDISRLKGKFVDVNVAGLDDTMFSDTLFGHRKGAYTGATDHREGLIARADNGTLFLDEIGDLNEMSQVKLLRLLQEHRYYPLGSDMSRNSTARIIVATNKDLNVMIAEGEFRHDLYYRLCAHQIQLPALRERREDIPLLVNQFLEEAAEKLKKKKPTIPGELITLLSTYSFPGNIRELRAMIFDAMACHQSGILSLNRFKALIKNQDMLQDNPADIKQSQSNAWFQPEGHFPTLKEAEDFLIQEALSRADNNQSIAAGLLGISRQALNKRLSRKTDPG